MSVQANIEKKEQIYAGDAKINEKLDKDRFRRDFGNVKEAYVEIQNRIQ